jgi:thiol-disulfide isomerase/thioredoxin
MLDRILPAVLLVAVLVAAGLFLYFGNQGPPAPSEFPPVDQLPVLGTIPASWSVTDLDGKEVSAEDLRGKVLFINHWATWCPPCMAEMPSIQALYESLVGSNVAFLIVSEEQPDKVRKVVTQKGWSMPIYLASERLPPVLESEGRIPATFIADRKGRVVFRLVGAKDWNTDDVRQFLTKIP